MEEVYCVWAWDNYYPSSGSGNLKGIYINEEMAKAKELELNLEGWYDKVKITSEPIHE